MSDILKVKVDAALTRLLVPDNTILKYATNLGESYADTLEVQNPEKGSAIGGYIGNAASLPVPIEQVTDDYNSFQAVVFNGRPFLIHPNEQEKLDGLYDKLATSLQDNIDYMMTRVVDYGVYKFAACSSSFQAFTTGSSNRTLTLTGNTGGVAPTGTRKKMTYADLVKMGGIMFRASKGNYTGQIYALITDDHFRDLMEMTEFTDQYRNGAAVSAFLTGQPIDFLGFKFIRRINQYGNTGCVFEDTTTTPKLYKQDTFDTVGGLSAAKDQAFALFFYPRALRYAMGFQSSVISEKRPDYEQARVVQFKMNFGAGITRKDTVGVAVLKDTWVTP